MKKQEMLQRFAYAFLQDKKAVTAIEYGVLAAAIALGIAAIFSGDGGFMTALAETFEKITEQLEGTSK